MDRGKQWTASAPVGIFVFYLQTNSVLSQSTLERGVRMFRCFTKYIREPEEGTEGVAASNEVYVNNEGGNEYQGDRVAVNGECNARWRGAQKSSHPSSELQLPNYRQTLYFLVPEILGFLCNFSLSFRTQTRRFERSWRAQFFFSFFTTQELLLLFISDFLIKTIFLITIKNLIQNKIWIRENKVLIRRH